MVASSLPPRLSRRQVLLVMGGVGAAAAAGLGGTLARWWTRAPGEGLVVFDADAHATLQALAEAWMPRGGTPALSGADAQLGTFVDGVVGTMDDTSQHLLKLLVHGLEVATLPTHGSGFAALPVGTRTEVLQGWLDHPQFVVRQPVSTLLLLMSLGWTRHPDVTQIVSPWYGCGYGT